MDSPTLHFPPLPSKNSQDIHQIEPGLSLQWLNEGRILVARLQAVVSTTLDAYDYCNRNIIGNWEASQPLLLLFDLPTEEMLDDADFRRSVEIVIQFAKVRGLKGKVALAIAENLSGDPFQAFLNSLNAIHPVVEAQIFHDFEAALGWLEES